MSLPQEILRTGGIVFKHEVTTLQSACRSAMADSNGRRYVVRMIQGEKMESAMGQSTKLNQASDRFNPSSREIKDY